MDLSKYADLFLTESREHLSAINHWLLELEREPSASEPVGAVFRAVHTVKGMSATMGYAAVTELAHELETLLDRVRRGEQAATRAVMDLFFEAADALEVAIEAAVRGGGRGADVGALVARLREVTAARPSELGAGGAALSGSPQNERVVRVLLTNGTPLRGARAFLVVKRAETFGAILSVRPSLQALQAEEFDRGFTIRLDSAAPAEEIVEALLAVGDVEQVEVDGREGERSSQAESGDAGGSSQAKAGRATRSVRIDLRRLDALMNLAGELVIARGRLAQLSAALGEPALEEAVGQASRLIGELQDEIMVSRMVPVEQVFDRFPRLVRDAARALGKEVTFTVQGKDIELDRSMLDDIGDPVMHLLRNAVDHGIELPEERLAAGKPPAGQLTLRVARERSSVTIQVIDDGRGIDRTRVLVRAREMGLVAPDRTELGDEELVRLIARPGFTTAQRVTNLSGRGVGIDVVSTRVRSMGGTLEIRSVQGAGTSVTVCLPLTLAVVRALLARVEGELYAVPITHVSETVELEATALKRVQGREVLVMRDDVLPLVQFRELVRLPPGQAGPRQVIVLEMGERRAGLVVDELTGQQDVVVKQFDAVRGASALFSGATILADGAPVLIVDVGSVV